MCIRTVHYKYMVLLFPLIKTFFLKEGIFRVRLDLVVGTIY